MVVGVYGTFQTPVGRIVGKRMIVGVVMGIV
jgi:hypothetical protein